MTSARPIVYDVTMQKKCGVFFVNGGCVLALSAYSAAGVRGENSAASICDIGAVLRAQTAFFER